jgi:fructose-bisphosphate aldolase, class II
MEQWCYANCADERKPGETDEQFVYKTRKKALGPFKRQLWELPTKDEILADQQKHMRYLFEQLAVSGSRALVERYIRPASKPRPAPHALLEAAALPARS